MSKQDLHLHEEILLLALSDEEGTMHSGTWAQTALGGALLGELFLDGAIQATKEGKKGVVEPVREPRSNDELVRSSYAKIRDDKKHRAASHWAAVFSGGDVLTRTAESLCRRGVLRMDDKKVLWLFKRKVYPEVDPQPEAALIERLRKAIFGSEGTVDPRTAVLVAVGNQTGLLRANFDAGELKARKDRIEGIARGDLAGEAAKGAVEATQTAFFVLFLMPAITAGIH